MNELNAEDIEDLGCVSRVLRGDTRAYGEIVDKYGKLIMKLAYNYLGRREDVEDASQEIFLEIFRCLNKFQLERRFLPWIYSIALNVLKRKYKKVIRFRELSNKLKLQKHSEPIEDPAQIAEEQETSRQIQEAVKALPEVLREVVVLYYLEELSVMDICTVLNLGSENVKSRLFRARKKLKKVLSGMQPD